MDLSKLNTNDWLISGGAIAFLISIFLPWYGIEAFGEEFHNAGSEYLLTGWLPLALLIIAFVLVVLPKLSDGVNLPDELGPLSRAQAALAAAALAAVLVVLRLIIPSDNIGSIDADVDLSRKYGLFLALLAVIAAAAGAFLNMQSAEDTAGPSSAPPTPF